MTMSFLPVAGRNAIDNCVLNVRFPHQPDQATLGAIRAEAARIAQENDLPSSQQVMVAQLFVGAPASPFSPISPNQPQAASVFQRYAPDGKVVAEFRCDPQGISLQTRLYESWDNLLAWVEKTILVILPFYMRAIPAILGVSLQYDDIFYANFSENPPSAFELFREDTKWVTLHDRKSEQQWHSHFGMFFLQSSQQRELVNVNVNVSDLVEAAGSWRRNVALTFLVSEAFDIPGEMPLILDRENAGAAVLELFRKAHDRQRQILEEVLADAYLVEIGAKVT
jgi:uncharacterized protein (TIGR04255 family)